MFEMINRWDWKLVELINMQDHPPALDSLMVLISHKWLWGAAVAAFAIWLFRAKRRHFRRMMTLLGITFLLSDAFCYRVIKENFRRLRPCHQNESVRTPDECGGYPGFPSNHASNGMALSTLINGLFANQFLWLYPIVVIVGFSRVYLGVHFPSDVLGGFLIGGFIGYAISRVGRRYVNKAPELE